MRFRVLNTPRTDFSDGIDIRELCTGAFLVLLALVYVPGV